MSISINMKLGVASSATQIEGGNFRHTWDDWYKKGHIRDGSDPARATDHLHRWKEDIDLMAEMGIHIYRLGIEWARIEPEQGRYDEAAVEWYRQLFIYMKSKKIEPLLTIHHFTNPLWFEAKKGFANPANIPVFLSFVEFVVKHFSDLVDEYVTINEPNVFSVMAYAIGVFPPGMRSLRVGLRVQPVMTACHIKAYELIHKMRREMGYTKTRVGFAHHARVFVPKSKRNIKHIINTWLSERMFQKALVPACLLGRVTLPLTKYGKIKPGEYADFLALNYYTRTTVTKVGDGTREGSFRNDLDWEIYPEGIAICARDLYAMLPRPIYITENGTCDNNDTFRCRFLYDHLKALVDSKLPVERYYHWSFTDNFEWCEGESARFGLVHVDYATQRRTIKKSGQLYSAIIKNGSISDEMYNEYVAPQEYHR